jgi:glycosyltransferase involved in cell wall biosynthesis
MILGINASNIRRGGGVTHLAELLRAADPGAHGFEQVVVWSGTATLARIEARPWLRKMHDPLLDRPLPLRAWWQRFRLARLARAAGCDVLLAPGASDVSGFRPMVAMSQNLLPFEWRESRRFGFSSMGLKLALLRIAQARTFRRADGVIFLTRYARDAVLKVTGPLRGETAIIPHGIHARFFRAPRPQRDVGQFDEAHPCRVLYVSIVDAYKHQWNVAEAVARLRASGLALTLELVGPDASGSPRLQSTLARIDPAARFVFRRGEVPHGSLHEFYASADVGVFASTCENLPIILLESMASGLPCVCSDRGPMPEVLGDAGEYCDPERPGDIARALRRLVESPGLRAEKAERAYARARQFSWTRCADETFGFLARICRTRRTP